MLAFLIYTDLDDDEAKSNAEKIINQIDNNGNGEIDIGGI